MACRNFYRTKTIKNGTGKLQSDIIVPVVAKKVDRLLFGVDSKIPSNDILQNNLTEFEWVERNKLYPVFWGRNIVGENSLTKEEIDFLHLKGCKIAAIYATTNAKKSEEEGKIEAKRAVERAQELRIPKGSAVFLEISERENASRDYMIGYAKELISNGYTPGFKANTDAAFTFDREFSRGIQTDKDIFSVCLVWAVSPSFKEYERITTSHLIHPDNWIPFAPSGITRRDIAIWEYGKDCHPIEDNEGKETTFNINLIRNRNVIIDKMF